MSTNVKLKFLGSDITARQDDRIQSLLMGPEGIAGLDCHSDECHTCRSYEHCEEEPRLFSSPYRLGGEVFARDPSSLPS